MVVSLENGQIQKIKAKNQVKLNPPHYSRVPNKRGAKFINFRNFVQGVRSYLGVVKYLLRGYVYSFWPKMSWGYDY